MTIMWSNRQLAECTWFVSLNGYDTVSAWNAYLASQSLPQDCTAANIGSSTYPFRSWAQVVVDTRSVTGEKVAVGLGKWGQDAQRTVWTKSMYWMGMTGCVIDMQLCTNYIARSLVVGEVFDTILVINGVYFGFYAQLTTVVQYVSFVNMFFDFFSINLWNVMAYTTIYLTNCTILDHVLPIQYNYRPRIRANNCTLLYNITDKHDATSILVNTITKIAYAYTYYCCFTDNASNNGSNNNIKADPLFNNNLINDYTLRSDSPCLYKGKDGAHIGAMGEARTIDPNSPEMADGTAIYSTTGGLTDLVKTSYLVNGVTMYILSLRTGKMNGTVETGWIDLGRTREVDSLRFVADMIYGAGGNYDQAPSPDLNKLSVSYKAALTESEKAGVAWVSTEWGAEDLAVSARYIKLLITVTSTTPAP